MSKTRNCIKIPTLRHNQTKNQTIRAAAAAAAAGTLGSAAARSPDIVEVARAGGTVRKMRVVVVERLEPGSRDSEVLPVARWGLADIRPVQAVRKVVADPEIRNLAPLEDTLVALLVHRKELRLGLEEVVDSGLDLRRSTIQEGVVLVGDRQGLRTPVEAGLEHLEGRC